MNARRKRQWLIRTGMYGLLTAVTAFALAPLLWALVTSVKPHELIVTSTPVFVPTTTTASHYAEVLKGSGFLRYLFNSILVAGLTILIVLAVASHGAYAAARFRFPGKTLLLFTIMATVMIPGIVVLVPLYLLAVKLKLYDTYWVMVLVYSAWQIPTALWLLRGFFEMIPRELDEAAAIDGCTPYQALRLVILPLVKPGQAAAAMVVFMYVWNEFILALTLVGSDKLRLLPVGLYYYVGAFGVEWGKLMAAICLAVVPALFLFLVLQKWFIHGLTAGATKG